MGLLGCGTEVVCNTCRLCEKAGDRPMLILCTAGTDRTGDSTAFRLSVLGVERDIIEADYLLTNIDVERQVDFLESTVGLPEGVDRELMMHHAGVPETAMLDFLNGLEETHGGVLRYLTSIGIDEATMNAVRRNFLEG